MIWRLTYCNKEGAEARIDIIKGNRTPVEVVQGSGNPFTLSYKLDKNDKSGHIMTSSADIEIFETETFNIDDLKTSNETELKVEYFEDNILTWSGFILPDFFSREIGSPNIVRMTASDRLTALKGVTLSDLPSKVSLRSLIERCLAKTGLSLGLVSQIQINQGSTNILDSEILSQRLTDVRGRSISCYDILMSIMVGTNSTIRQRKGQWHVYNKLEHELRAPTISFDKVEKGAMRTIQPVASSVGVYNEFGGNRLHPNNYDFSLGLANWTARNGFEAYIDNRVVLFFLSGAPYYEGDVTTKDYLVNYNDWITNETNLDTAPFLESNNIPISSTQDNTVEVDVDISAVMAEKLSSYTAISFLRYAIIATNGVDTYALTTNGIFEAYDPEKIDEHSIVLRGGQQPPLILASPAYAKSEKRKGLLEVENVNDFHVNIRIYGSSFDQYVNVEFVSVKFDNKIETPKGNLYKTTQGSNFTKLHDVETVIFGDYIRSGLNGYFYNYPIDDTSILYLPSGELSPPEWITVFDTTERPLLHHVSRQKSRLFSVAHDILKANINVESFDPLAVFQDCKGGKYVVVSASFDFLRSEVDVELEQIAEDTTILKRDFIYSYFGEGEDTIKSIGGIAGGGGGTGGGVGGGMTSEQLEMLTNLADWWKLDEENDAIYSEKSVYSLKGVSALGLGSEGGGGGGGSDYDRLDSWVDYNSTISGWVLSAGLGYDLHTRVLSVSSSTSSLETRVTSLESQSGSGLTPEQLEQLANLSDWWKLDEEGNLYTEKNMYSQQGVSALGLGGGGGSGGGGVDMLDSWANYTPAKSNFYVPANLLTAFRTDVLNRLTSLESGSATSITTTGSGNAITSLTNSGSVITANKGLTFALSTHNHTIAQITGLETALNGKEASFTKNTAFNKNFGTTAGTVAQGNDSRINNGQTAYGWGNHASEDYASGKILGSIKIPPNQSGWYKVAKLNRGAIKIQISTTGGSWAPDTYSIDFYKDWSLTVNLQLQQHSSTNYFSKARVTGNNTTGYLELYVNSGSTGVQGDIYRDSLQGFNTGSEVFTGDLELSNETTVLEQEMPFRKKGLSLLGSVTAPTFIGALSGNASSATKLQTARTIAGVSFDGTANINIPFANLASKPTTLSGYEITDAVTLNTTQTITGAKTFSSFLTASAGVNTPKVDLGNGFTIEPSGTELVFKYSGVIKQRMLSNGTILAVGGITALSTG